MVISIYEGIPSKHFVHFGRTMGAIIAELVGAESSEIKGLGNWNPDTQQQVYSSKLPTGILKLMAGFSKKELYDIPRLVHAK